jgi:hypothetical protein
MQLINYLCLRSVNRQNFQPLQKTIAIFSMETLAAYRQLLYENLVKQDYDIKDQISKLRSYWSCTGLLLLTKAINALFT